jgi:predicted GNAT family acetyltransferase
MVPPEARNRGWATRGLCAIVDRLLEWRPAVGLFCFEHNAAARRVYERVGFRSLFHYRSWLLDEPLAPDPPGKR